MLSSPQAPCAGTVLCCLPLPGPAGSLEMGLCRELFLSGGSSTVTPTRPPLSEHSQAVRGGSPASICLSAFAAANVLTPEQ